VNKETYEGMLTVAEINLLERKNWTLQTYSELYDVLVQAYQRTAHRGRQITSKWINKNYSEVNVRVNNHKSCEGGHKAIRVTRLSFCYQD